jgi:thioredoxin 1
MYGRRRPGQVCLNPGKKIALIMLIVLALPALWLFKNRDNVTAGDSSGDDAFLLHVTDSLDMDELKSHGLPLIIDFGADSCIPCKEMAPVLKELNETLKGKAIIKFVDVWKYRELTEGYPLRTIPTQFFFDRKGKPFIPSDISGIPMITYSSEETDLPLFTAHEGGLSKEQLLDILREMGVE